MKRWLNTALALVLMLAIAAGGFFLPNFVSARLDRRNQDAEFSLSTGDEQSPATVLRLKLTDGIQNLFYGTEEPVELDESAAVHTLVEMAQYAQDLLGALEKDSALFGGGFSVQEGATVQYANYGSGFVLWGITLSNPRGDTASFLLDDATGCVLALSYEFAYDFGFQIRQNDLWDYLLRVFENRVGATVAAALGEPYDEVQIPMPDAAQELCDGGGVCTEHADAREVVCLHDGHLLTKKVSAKRVWPYLSGDCDPSGNALASKRHHCALKYKVFSTRHAGREKAVSASGS